jgi:hypothetical protein
LRLGHKAKFGIASARHERAHEITHPKPTRAGTTGDNAAGDLETRHVRYARRWRVAALTLEHIGTVDAGTHDFD